MINVIINKDVVVLKNCFLFSNMKKRVCIVSDSKVRAKTHVEKVLVGLTVARPAVVAEYVFIIGTVDTYANHRVTILAERAHTRQFARYLEIAHRVASLEQL